MESDEFFRLFYETSACELLELNRQELASYPVEQHDLITRIVVELRSVSRRYCRLSCVAFGILHLEGIIEAEAGDQSARTITVNDGVVRRGRRSAQSVRDGYLEDIKDEYTLLQQLGIEEVTEELRRVLAEYPQGVGAIALQLAHLEQVNDPEQTGYGIAEFVMVT